MNYRQKYYELIERLENVSDTLTEFDESSTIECPNCVKFGGTVESLLMT